MPPVSEPPGSPAPPPPPPPPGSAQPISEAVRRKTVLAIVEVAKLRQNSALVWAITWALFLALLAAGAVAVGSESTSPASAVASGIWLIFAAILLPAAASIFFGWASSDRWGQEYREIVLDPYRLPLAWLPGVRVAKAAWNRSRTFLWLSWAIGPEIVLGALIGLAVGGGARTCTSNYVPGSGYVTTCTTPAWVYAFYGAIILSILVFLLCRGFHHYFFAKSVSAAAEQLTEEPGPSSWQRDRLMWVLGAFAVPLDPVFLYLITLFASAASIQSTQSDLWYFVVLGTVAIAGVVALGASILLMVGYRQVRHSASRWLMGPAGPSGIAKTPVPPEWFGG
ncbi:MAG: hypothetical protein KGJ23_04615 [Euryarchaeota archaeon]|nr:hypothetical protein [Euryarchaeota archaeon]MDE1835881.1 hypothetical protein [Euryarchaeota archaeon]MDE1881388.1 hypothetical protein [Euryarchaeota archaeon]MDE2044441.1 hypothetical protein [Thermoplasmata archaeon]